MLVDVMICPFEFSRSIIVEDPLPGVTVAPFTRALAPVKVTDPKLANGTNELPEVKSSTIHSALVPGRGEFWLLKV